MVLKSSGTRSVVAARPGAVSTVSDAPNIAATIKH
jgi:hypothetical protein